MYRRLLAAGALLAFIAGCAGGSSNTGDRASDRDVRHDANGEHYRQHGGIDDLLHGGRKYADDRVDGLRNNVPGECDDDGEGDRDGAELYDERDGYLGDHHSDGSSDAGDRASNRDIRHDANGEHHRQHCGIDDLLHGGR